MEANGNSISHSERILVIEDDDDVRKVVRAALKSKGYEILEATNVDQAIDLATSNCGHLDLVLTDLIMPGLNGRKIAQRITERDPKVHVLFMSGYTEDLLEEEDADIEGAAFIGKPFTLENLLKKVEEVIHTPVP